MKVAHHAVIGAAAALPLVKWSLPGAICFFVASILADADHIVFYFLHEKRVFFPSRKIIIACKNWDYFGPRIHIFHNYEVLLLCLIFISQFGGFVYGIFGGLLIHLACDQLESYRLFRYLRVRSVLGDILRYKKYASALQEGREREFMISRRDSWWNHLCSRLSPEKLSVAERKCDILRIHPEKPINATVDGRSWQKFL